MPKRSGLITKREVAIGARVRQFRKSIGWTQPAFAYELGITRNKLASIEHGHTPLRYDTAKVLCGRFNLSEMWLAEGIGQPHPNLGLAVEIEQQISPRLLFSKVFQTYIEPLIPKAAHTAASAGIKVFSPPLGLSPERRHEWVLGLELKGLIQATPMHFRDDLRDALLAAADDFCKKRGLERVRSGMIRPTWWPKDRPMPTPWSAEKKPSTGFHESVKSQYVHFALPSLMSHIKALTTTPGSKTALARHLRVPLGSLSQWLSGSREPGGEVTLRLLAWVQAEEEKQKRAGCASTPPALKTRMKGNREKTKQSSPP